MKTRVFFHVNLGIAIFLGLGWIYFYYFIIMDDISRMPRALLTNETIAGLNMVFLTSLILIPFTYRYSKRKKL